MRDIIITLMVFSTLPYILRNPWYGVLAWSWLSYQNPHRLAWGFAYSMPFAQIVAIVLLASLLMSPEKKTIPKNPLVTVWAAFLLWLTYCTFQGLYPDLALTQLEKIMKIQLITFVTMLLLTSFERINQLIWVIIFSIGFYSVKGGIFTFMTGGGAAKGLFLLDGKVLAASGRLDNNCPASPTTLNERVAIPAVVSDAILDRVLSRPVSRLGSTGRFTEIVTVTYTRSFTDIDPAAITRTATLLFRVTVLAGFDDIAVDESQLVAVSGNAGGSFQSLVQAASRPNRVTWNAAIESVGEGSRLTVRSDNIQFRTASGQVLQTVPKRLSQVFNPRFAGNNNSTSESLLALLGRTLIPELNAAPARRTTLRFNESISIPPGVIAAARRSGSGAIQIARIFTDGRNRIESILNMALGGQAGADFQVTRVDIRFTGGERLKVITEGEPLQLIADINYLGTGLLRATWEVAPLGAAGRPLFRPLPASTRVLQTGDFSGNSFGTRQTRTLVRQYLNSFQRASFRSPTLPTISPGQYLVRLRIDSPELLFESPVIEYFVGNKNSLATDVLTEVIPISINSPAEGDELRVGSTLSWSPVGLTVAYRYELYADNDPDSELISGAVIPGDQSSATLSPLVADRLDSNRDYWWRVVAIDEKGVEHGASVTRKVRVGAH